MTKRESRKQRSNLPAMQRSHFIPVQEAIIRFLKYRRLIIYSKQ
ncbi:hypothetical protein [Porphyromonas pogonae]|nr:hypothetical protein [Porphyromonas pogonae]